MNIPFQRLNAIVKARRGVSADQLCGLARCYAGAGDGEFRARLAEIVERKPIADRPWLGEEEIVALDGEAGFVLVAGARGRILARDELARLLSAAEERGDQVTVAALVRRLETPT